MSRAVWMLSQSAAIIWLTVAMHNDDPKQPLGMIFFINVCLVAFLTAVLVNLWDWLARVAARIAGRVRQKDDRGSQSGGASATSGSPRQLSEQRSRPSIR